MTYQSAYERRYNDIEAALAEARASMPGLPQPIRVVGEQNSPFRKLIFEIPSQFNYAVTHQAILQLHWEGHGPQITYTEGGVTSKWSLKEKRWISC